MNTYFIYSQFMDADMMEKVLVKRGNWKKYIKGNNVDFLFINRAADKNNPDKNILIKTLNKFYGKNIGIENYMEIDNIDKYTLIENFLNNKKEKKYVQNQIALDPYNLNDKVYDFFKKGKIYLIKPVGPGRGEGIFAIKDKNELIDNYYKLKNITNMRQIKLKKQNKPYWLLQEYIKNPMLFMGKKFHLRTYYIITGEGDAFLSETMIVVLAKKLYIPREYNNKEIHDSHGVAFGVVFTEKNHEGFSDQQYIKMKKDIVEIHKKFISKIAIKCYEKVDFCFHILGADIMFTEEGQLKLLEINLTSSMDSLDHEDIFEGIAQEIIDKKYPPKIKQPKNTNLIKLN